MKKLYTLITALILTASAMSQAPEKMSYQAVVRDAGNVLQTNKTVGMRVSILKGSVTGTPMYVETHTPTTNMNGLISIEIASGTIISGTFNTIDWSNGPYFIKTETDPTGGTNYTITGTTQLLSVPYALHANTADSIAGGVNITETDPVFGSSVAKGITGADTAHWNKHFDGKYSSLIGAPKNVSTFNNDAGYLTTEIDGSTTNEIQTISRIGTTVTLSKGGGSFTDSVNIYTGGSNITVSGNTINQVTNMQPYTTINYIICTSGIFPSNGGSSPTGPFVGEIKMFAGNFPPGNWMFCDGQLLSIASYTALFALLGTTYGGNGTTTFALPDLRGRTPIHEGTGPGLTNRNLGSKGGVE